tara:strand:- start:187 stop:501 length:315 start_codon:yes stop_codon:yes gene_type:complete
MNDYAVAVYIMPDIWTLIASGVCGGICGRVASYQRCGSRYRFGVSLCAWLLAVGSGGYSLSVLLGVLLGLTIYATSPFILLLLFSLLVLVWRARGNVAAVLRAE